MAIGRDQEVKWFKFYKGHEPEITAIRSNPAGSIEFVFSDQMYADLFCSELFDLSYALRKEGMNFPVKNTGSLLSKTAGIDDDSEQFKIVTFSKDQYIVLQTMLNKLKSYDDLTNANLKEERKAPAPEKKEIGSPSKRKFEEKRPAMLEVGLSLSPSAVSLTSSSSVATSQSVSGRSIFSPDDFGSPNSSKSPLLSPNYFSHPIFSLSRSKPESKRFNFPLPLPSLEKTQAMISSWQENKIHIKYPHSLLLNYLSTEDIFNYRTVSRAMLKETTEMKGLYLTFADFVFATSGTFYKNKQSSEKNKESCQVAWALYYKTIIHKKCKKPSLLYKMKNKKMKIGEFAADEKKQEADLVRNSRLYAPGRPEEKKHNLVVNAVWTLAQIHIGRPFVAISDITEENFQRYGKPGVPSAFAKEITAIYKAGYTISGLNHRGCLTFSPTLELNKLQQLTIRDIQANDSDIEAALATFGKQQTDFYDIFKVVNEIKTFFHEIDNDVYSENELFEFKKKYTESSSDLLNILKNQEQQKTCVRFITLFNSKPQVGPIIPLPASSGFFDKTKLFILIEKNILNMIHTKIDAAVGRLVLQNDSESDSEEEELPRVKIGR